MASRNSKSKPLGIILAIAVIIIGLPLIFFGGRAAIALTAIFLADDSSKQRGQKDKTVVAAEVPRYSFLQICSVKSRNDGEAGLDSSYSYIATYQCPERSWGAVHDDAVANLHSLGYSLDHDELAQEHAPSYTYNTQDADLSYHSACCDLRIEPVFIKGYFATDHVEGYKAQPLQEFQLLVSANHRSEDQ
jgi:hypothetical protein